VRGRRGLRPARPLHPAGQRGRPGARTGGDAGAGRALTVLAFGQTEARTVLRNAGDGPLTYRLEATNAALTLDTAPAELAPGEEVELVVAVDLAALSPADVVLPVQVITSGGALLWSLQVDALPEAGSFRGTVTFDAGGFYLGRSGITVDLDFRDDGTVAGRVDTEASLLWPQPLALTGTWDAERRRHAGAARPPPRGGLAL
jgi:hypothetical protein